MGDHTDYNEGFVLPVAIDMDCAVVSRPRADGLVHISSLDFAGLPLEIAADGSHDPATVEPAWGRLAAGVVRVLGKTFDLGGGLDAVIASRIPIGSGLSSSAAVEVALALALLDRAERTLPSPEIARACAEAEFAATGVPCGVMDQLASLEGRAGHALLIDCRSLTVEQIPLPEGIRVFAVHSGLPRALAGTEYAGRRAATERIAASMGLATLRDATLEEVLTEPYARHVVTENLRTLVTARALRRAEKPSLSEMFSESHKSLRDDYRVSTPELDTLVELLTDAGAIGARLTGAGFGGCVVALANEAEAPSIADRAVSSYREATGLTATVYWCNAVDGAGPIDPDEIT
jgi:galactokinase